MAPKLRRPAAAPSRVGRMRRPARAAADEEVEEGRPVTEEYLPPESLPEGYSGKGWHLVSRVLPMGFVNSVAIAQHVRRRVIQQALGGEKRLAGRDQEIRRDRRQSFAPHQYRVYLDNYDELNRVDKRMAETLQGTPSAWTLAVRETYQQLGLPRHPKKGVTQEIRAEVHG